MRVTKTGSRQEVPFHRRYAAVGVVIGMALVLASWNGRLARAAEPFVVHEWGTFTELQNQRGIAIGGINTDDEPVPEFVHRISKQLLERPISVYPISPLAKGVPAGFMPVTSRLETPVVYFYPPKSARGPLQADVEVQFRGGWVSEYYPAAQVNAPGLKTMELTPSTVGTIRWKGLQVGGDGPIPETSDPVWTTPRVPGAARVVTPEGEAEDYLFYRGVGNFSGPLRVITDHQSNQLQIESRWCDLEPDHAASFADMWLVEVQQNGDLSFRRLEGGVGDMNRANLVTTTPRHLEAGEGGQNARQSLYRQMHAALKAAGLYEDEATAMLGTWDRAYFQSPGMRLFYVVPRAWTDDRLPLSVRVDNQEMGVSIERVMMGRIELVTDAHKQRLARLKSGPVSLGAWVRQLPDTPGRAKLLAGDTNFGDLGVSIPDDYRQYLELGRFRNALIQHELKRRPSDALVKFAERYGLRRQSGFGFETADAGNWGQE